MPLLLLLSIRLRGTITLWLCPPSVPSTLSSDSNLEVTRGQGTRLLLTHSPLMPVTQAIRAGRGCLGVGAQRPRASLAARDEGLLARKTRYRVCSCMTVASTSIKLRSATRWCFNGRVNLVPTQQPTARISSLYSSDLYGLKDALLFSKIFLSFACLM